MQQNLFEQTTAGLIPNTDPYIHHKSRINRTKADHYEAHISSDKGKRQVDLVFDALMAYPDSTDRELQSIIESWGHKIEISAIPARRADIPKFFPGWMVRTPGKKICSVMHTAKYAWRLTRTPSGQLH